MLNVYLLTLALAGGIALGATLLSVTVPSFIRLTGVFHRARGLSVRPPWGGVAIFVAFAVTPFVASAVSDHAAGIFEPKSSEFIAFLLACTLIFAVGLVDDWRVLGWRTKLLAQVAAASAVYSAGFRIDEVGLPWGQDIPLSYAAPVITVLWVVFFTNAINLIDGRDGVAAGVAVLAAVTLAQVAANADHPTVALLLVALAGAGLGMLPFNLPPSMVFLGDAGALLMGFILGALSIRATTGVADEVFIAIPIVAMGFPILDTLLAVVRRAADHRHPLLGDQDHIHHRLEVTGFGPRGLLVVVYGVSVLFAAGAITLHFVHIFALEVAVLLGTLLLVVAVLTKLGYALSFWNSASVIWLRRRLRWSEAPAGERVDRD